MTGGARFVVRRMEKPVKSGWTYALAVLALVAVAFGAYVMMPVAETAKPATEQKQSRTSNDGLYFVSIEPEAGEIAQGSLQAWIVTVKTADGKPVDGATITVGGGMPAHNHGLPTDPQMTAELGDGRYRIDGVKFSMSGRWELRFAIKAAAGSDSATFYLVI